MRSEVLTAVKISRLVLRVATLCGLVEDGNNTFFRKLYLSRTLVFPAYLLLLH